ncbi:cGMP-dependent protein kinase 2-like [Macadamia integrifolia]|uniref:cGMP-dependent protein kinase 2-like n=1 Tax=Macadamia integrifolia TaxID=60698 RepID=UPI001C4E7D06|nr:cGMP-dependent protein kinase 2-like [Macadamia integrifolia]
MAALDCTSTAFTIGCSSYDVFLNFRGEDTRNNFTGFLNLILKDKGIDVFIDSEKLWSGEAIGPALLRAIDGSKISIPVFSTGYAHSKWCLLELAQIFQCYISNRQLVLPIFFNVEPSHVRNQTGSFEEAFREHEKNHEPHIVKIWRKALREIGNLKGEIIDKNKNQAEIVELIVKRVRDEVYSSTHLEECKYPIGIDSRAKDLLSLLSVESSSDVKFIGICGSHGIGKSTIVEAVYNRILSSFNSHSFISDVSKQAKECMGLISLQKRLLKDIIKTDYDIGHYRRGKKLIERILCKENVLLVLDDVDDTEQVDALASELNWFGQGSRVIITTKNRHILKKAKVDKDKIYCPRELDHEESLQLFSLHTFSADEPPQDYMQLSHDMVSYLGGLPLTIEKLGSYLSEIRSKEEWTSTLRKLKSHKSSISHLIASLRKQRNNPLLGWYPQLHGTIGFSNTVARVSKVLGRHLDLNGHSTTFRVLSKWFTAAKNQDAISFKSTTRGNLNPIGSTTTYRVVQQFTIEKILAATKNFHKSGVIGVGGFGTVYKGVLDDGNLAAFKRCNLHSKQGLREFLTEIEMLSNLRHKHVVSMIGFCNYKNEMILVYEYMVNGNLKNHLYGSDLPPLTWKQRLEICISVAGGLHYLHTGPESGIIHRDVKTTNILLNENFVAKLTDFGLSKTGHSLEETHVSTDVKGTIGYLDPEYFRRQQLTEKSDVYSFGVVLFEVVCARPVFDRRSPEDQVNLKEWALCWQRQRSLQTIADPCLEGNYCPESLKKFGEIAEKCVADEGKNRPTMGEVLQDLEFVLQLHEAWCGNKPGEEHSTHSSLVSNDDSNPQGWLII